jgi:arginine exporter protein ArgO
MKEILDIIVWGGFIFILFIYLRGMNETQVQKHKDKLDESQDEQKEENNHKGQ